jgi:hypothetical protein
MKTNTEIEWLSQVKEDKPAVTRSQERHGINILPKSPEGYLIF